MNFLCPIRSLRQTIFLVALLTWINLAFAQQQSPSDLQQQSPGDLQQPQNSATTSGSSTVQQVRVQDVRRYSLSATQIDSILQQHPDLIVELKSLLADQLQQAGVNALAD